MMSVHTIFQRIQELPKTQQFLKALSAPNTQILLQGLQGSSLAMYSAAVTVQAKGVHVFVLNDKEEAAYFFNDLQSLLPNESVFFFPASYRVPYQFAETDNANVLLRTEVLSALKHARKAFVVTFPEAVCEFVLTRKSLKSMAMRIAVQEKISHDFVTEVLNTYAFERVDFVYQPGQFSVRGGIVDVFSYASDLPYRIEFIGDEVESLRTFQPEDQLSVSRLQEVEILPDMRQQFASEELQSFLSFLPADTTVWIKNTSFSADCIEQYFQHAQEMYAQSDLTLLPMPPPDKLYLQKTSFLQALHTLRIIEFGAKSATFYEHTSTFKTALQPIFNKNFTLLAEDLKRHTESRISNFFLTDNPKQYERLQAIFENTETQVDFHHLPIVLHEGFVFFDILASFYTDHQVFNRYHKYKIKSLKQPTQALTLKELTSLQPGDFITHIDHGVGKFSGLEKLDVNGKQQEAIRIIYKNGDMLYVSIHALHKIARYSGKEGSEPVLDRLGSGRWENIKQKTKRKVKEIAFDLISLYAQRKASKGFAFSPDNYLQTELEASFIYEDTPDQQKSSRDVKADMEKDYPMDRLVCGDVGFGKTEIAIRAAFKAVCDSKQVAILVPTTILALQHFKTFSERLKDFPCTIDYINRFKSSKQQRETIQKVAQGKIDILIGTHRLLGSDLKFKDLGLLIIDEEQKFGVGSKDKLKTLKVNVDTLTLTATPIPRTLQFSLMGARDLSVINTPPPNRQPIQTEVHGFNEALIRDAISFEINRNGQVFVIHNHIKNLTELAGAIQRLCPDARVLVAHGQLKGDELEEKMLAFIEGEYDVLVSTTIIESGLDIPNANTIIIHDAHMFGLSDLHQMRGRVGRSNKKAFCYLLAPPLSVLTSEARKRLQAIEQFSDLGSGFQIAMRDLDIRGAGNILGAEQSGFISEIGFEMYQKIIQEALQELKENEFKHLFEQGEGQHKYVADCQIDCDLEILIPDQYVTQIAERLALYTELDTLKSEEELKSFASRLSDRFGEIPKETHELFDTIRLRWEGENAGFEKITVKQGKMLCYFISNPESGYYQSEMFQHLLKFIQENPGLCVLKEKNHKLYLLFNQVSSIHEAFTHLHRINLALMQEKA